MHAFLCITPFFLWLSFFALLEYIFMSECVYWGIGAYIYAAHAHFCINIYSAHLFMYCYKKSFSHAKGCNDQGQLLFKEHFLNDELTNFSIYCYSPVPTIIIAHEFFDALPIHQFQVSLLHFVEVSLFDCWTLYVKCNWTISYRMPVHVWIYLTNYAKPVHLTL